MVGTWQRLTPAGAGSHILTTSGTTLDSGTIVAKDHLRVTIHTIATGGNIKENITFNSDGGGNYSRKRNNDGVNGDSNDSGQNQLEVYGDTAQDRDLFMNIKNTATKMKLVTADYIQNTAGKTNQPSRTEWVGKWSNQTNPITKITVTCSGTGSYAAGSYITVWGASGDVVTDEKTTLTNIPLNTRYEEVDTRKIYRAVEKLDVSDDLTTDKGWNSNSNDFTYNATNYSIDLSPLRRNQTSQQIYIDVQNSDYLNGNNLSDTSFIFRFGKIRWNTVPAGGGVTANIMLSKGLQDSGTNQYSVNLQQILNSSEAITRARANDGSTNNEGNSTDVQSFSSTYTPNTSNIYRWEIVRDGNDFAFKVYAENDSSYNTPLETKTVTATGITDLRYILITNDSEQTNSTTADMEILGNIDIYNGTTTTTGVNWKERGVA